MSQEIKNLKLKDLVLWTENPRAPVDTRSSEQEIADRAIISDGRSRWSLNKLFEKMGNRFDQSEIPTVAYVRQKPVVYDGNRRILIGKIIHGYVDVEDDAMPDLSKFDFPRSIPCNVCDLQTALEHVDRKHADSGSWAPLERDIFKHKHMKERKSPFLIIEEATQIISQNPEMNQRFVKEEIFDLTTLRDLGFTTNNGILESNYKNDKDADAVLNNIIDLVENKVVTTRRNRGKAMELVESKYLNKQGSSFKPYNRGGQLTQQRKTRISKGKKHQLFGGKLLLDASHVNNIYSDLIKLYKEKDKGGLSEDFPMIIRMGLRLVCEIASKDKGKGIQPYITKNWKSARENLSQDERTTLRAKAINSGADLVTLLHIGAHGYTVANDIEQTLAMSLIIGKILEESHGK